MDAVVNFIESHININAFMICILILALFFMSRGYLFYKFGIYPILNRYHSLRITNNAISIILTVGVFISSVVW